MRKKWIVVSEFGKLSVPKKITKTRDVADAMDGNAHFPTPDPSLASFRGKADDLEDKESEASTGDHEAVAEMHKLETDLEIMFTNQSHYVEQVANDDFENGEAIIKSSGLKPKKVAVHTPRQFKVTNTDMPGQVKAVTQGVKARVSFIWQFKTGGAVFATAGTTVKAQIIISALTGGLVYSFRVAVVTKDGQGPWSNPFDLRVL